MNQYAVNLVVADQAFTPGNTLFDADGVRGFAVGFDQFVQVVVHEPESRSIYNAGDVQAVGFQRFEQVRQFRPAGDPFEHDTMLFFEGSGGGAFLHMLFQFLGQQFESFSSFHTATGGNHVSHMVEQVEPVERSRFVLQVVANLQPCFGSTVGVLAALFEFVFIELLAGDFFHLTDGRIQLGSDVFHVGFVDMVEFVVRNVDHDQRNVVPTGNVFIPFGHAVADVVAAQHEVRHGHGHLTIFVQGILAAGLFFPFRQSSDFIDVVGGGKGFQGLGIDYGFAICVEYLFAIGIFHLFAAVGVDDIVAIFVHFVGTPEPGSISQGNTGIAADIVVITDIFCSLAHHFAVTVGSDTSSLVFRIPNMQTERFSQFAGELGRGPAYFFSSFFGFPQFSVNLFNYISQCLNARAYCLWHNDPSFFT